MFKVSYVDGSVLTCEPLAAQTNYTAFKMRVE